MPPTGSPEAVARPQFPVGLDRGADRASNDADVSSIPPIIPYGGFSPVRLEGWRFGRRLPNASLRSSLLPAYASQLVDPASSDLPVLEGDRDRRPAREHLVRRLSHDDPVEVRGNLPTRDGFLGIAGQLDAAISNSGGNRVFHAELALGAVPRRMANQWREHAVARLDLDKLDVGKPEIMFRHDLEKTVERPMNAVAGGILLYLYAATVDLERQGAQGLQDRRDVLACGIEGHVPRPTVERM